MFFLAWLGATDAAESAGTQPAFFSSLAAARESASSAQELVLVDFSATWCAPCKALKKNTFAAKAFLENAGPLCVAEVDIDADERTARAFDVTAVPTLVLLTGDGKIVARRAGYVGPDGLLTWLKEGRQRVQRGQWEGVAPSSKIEELSKKTASDGTNDVPQLIALLGNPDPAERTAVSKLLLAQPERAVPPLIAALGDPYLGVRIAASELLASLAPTNVVIDPWQSPAELAAVQASLRQWWSQAGPLRPTSLSRPPDASTENSIQAALEKLTSENSIRRTEGMSTLVSHGPVALPFIRAAIKRQERSNPRAVFLLEDVRWAILISDSLDDRVGGVRSALARGTSQERQAAAARLGRAGREGIGPLSELANDPDPLVVESAVRALSAIGGKDAVPALAALMQAADPNLRMAAAQALGRAKAMDATKPLLGALNDTNEVVVCTALAALEEVHALSGSNGRQPPPELVAGLKGALADERWRVRAAAVEIIGKLRITQLMGQVKSLLGWDEDGFVVRNALTALNTLGLQMDAPALAGLARRHPGLRPDVVALMAKQGSSEDVKEVEKMYLAANTGDRLAILKGLASHDRYDNRKLSDAWKPLLTQVIGSSDAQIRAMGVTLLRRCSNESAADLVEPLLADPDPTTRAESSVLALRLLAMQSGSAMPATVPSLDWGEENAYYGSTDQNTRRTVVKGERLSKWHDLLLKRAEADPVRRAGVYVTGDRSEELSALVDALQGLHPPEVERLTSSGAVPAILPKLTWPEGKPLVDCLSQSPRLFVLAVLESGRAAKPVTEYLRDPARIKAALEPLAASDLGPSFQMLLGGYGENRGWSLLSQTPSAKAVVSELVSATNPVWRAAALFALGRKGAAARLDLFQTESQDPNPWVRAAAVQGLARASSGRSNLEERLGPFLADEHSRVREVAALGLLEPDLRNAAGWHWQSTMFQYEKTWVNASEPVTINEDQPLKGLNTKPAYLNLLRDHLINTNGLVRSAFALLLAQHGDFDGIARMVAERQSQPGEESRTSSGGGDALLTGIALSRDPQYIPFLRQLMEGTTQEWELRKILRAVRSANSAEARAFRAELNARMRRLSGGGGEVVD